MYSHSVLLLLALALCGLASQVSWKSCPVYTNVESYGYAAVSSPSVNTTAECANISTPLMYDQPEEGNTTFFVKRVLAMNQPSKGQVWLLQGGPGGSGIAMETLIPYYLELMPDYDIMIPDHRGVFRSNGLWCPQRANLTDENMEECVAFLNKTYKLDAFTTSNAAMDLARAINLTTSSKDKVYIYGVSYGSYWAQRYLVLAPDQASRVAIDGICPPDICRLADYYDVNTNIAGSDFMSLCGEQSKTCNSYLGDFPMELLALIMELTESGEQECAKKLGITGTQLRNMWGSMVMSEQNRLLIPPMVKRLVQCSDSDQKDLQHFIDFQSMQQNSSSTVNASIYMNVIISSNIGLSEMYSVKQPPQSAEYYQQVDQSLFFSVDLSTSFSNAYPLWPKYDPESTPGYNQYPVNVTTPLLLIEGELDPQTTHAWALHAMQRYTQGQEFYSVPYAPHGAAFESPFKKGTSPCGTEIIASWFLTGKADTSCLKKLVPPDFEGSTDETIQLSKTYFGTSKLWGK